MYRNIDAIGYTNYLGWYEEPYATPRRARAASSARSSPSCSAVFPDKVIAVTEFGAEGTHAQPDRPARRPRVPGRACCARTSARTRSIPDLTGMLVWNLRDFAVAPSFGGGSITEVVDDISLVPGLNEKGLHTYTGRPKPAAHAVREEFARLRAAGG